MNQAVDNATFSWKKVLIFLALTFFLTALFDVPSVLLNPSGEKALMLFITAATWCPAIAAFLTKRIFRESIKDLGWKWGKETGSSFGIQSLPSGWIIFIYVAFILMEEEYIHFILKKHAIFTQILAPNWHKKKLQFLRL